MFPVRWVLLSNPNPNPNTNTNPNPSLKPTPTPNPGPNEVDDLIVNEKPNAHYVKVATIYKYVLLWKGLFVVRLAVYSLPY